MKAIMQLGRKYAALIMGLLVVMSLAPILYCGMFNYASADDFSKSYTVHDVLLNGGNVLDAIHASILAAANVWKIWEGTWASNFFLAFQPSIWGEHAYAVTVPLCILYTLIGTGYLLWELVKERMRVPKRVFWILFWLQAALFLQFMPYIRGGMFWYTGMAHYVMPMCFTLLMTAWMLKWERTGKKRYYIYMLIDGIYLGGSHYQHIILILLVLLTGWLWSLLIARQHQRQMMYLWIPMAEILCGLYVCVISPGNLTRGGEGFGLHVEAILTMPFSCMAVAGMHGAEYVMQTPLLIPFCILAFVIGWRYVRWQRMEGLRRVPVGLTVLYLFLLYAAAEAPGIYAAENTAGISGGYYDIVYQCLILFMLLAFLLFGGWMRERSMEQNSMLKRMSVSYRNRTTMQTILTAALAVLVFACLKPCVKRSAAYTCYDFVKSGHLRDFVIQMEERIELLRDPELVDIYVPEMNDEQGPFMHLQLSQDSSNYTNEATALYYHKHSVTAVPRDQYYKEYAEIQDHEIPVEYQEMYRK